MHDECERPDSELCHCIVFIVSAAVYIIRYTDDGVEMFKVQCEQY